MIFIINFNQIGVGQLNERCDDFNECSESNSDIYEGGEGTNMRGIHGTYTYNKAQLA